jgi:hypothetical protein
VKHLLLDSSRIDSQYAAREYTRTVFSFNAEVAERYRLENLYRRGKEGFRDDQLVGLNEKLTPYQFGLRTSIRSNLETDLIITKDGIPIEHRGKGEQCFIKTQFALRKHEAQGGLNALLLEEPENHLSHTNMKRLVEQLANTKETQLFIATHSSHICSRLDLRHALLLGTGQKTGRLKALSDDTTNFFMKAPDNNVLEFALSIQVAHFPRYRVTLARSGDYDWTTELRSTKQMAKYCEREKVARGFGLSGRAHWGKRKQRSVRCYCLGQICCFNMRASRPTSLSCCKQASRSPSEEDHVHRPQQSALC